MKMTKEILQRKDSIEQRKQSIEIDTKTNNVIHQSESTYKLQSSSQNQQLSKQQQQQYVSPQQLLNNMQQNKYNNKTINNTSEQIGTKDEIARDLLTSLINLTDTYGVKLQQKYNIEYIRQVLQRDLILFETGYLKFVGEQNQTSKGINLVDFIFLMTSLVDIPSHETIYLIIAIIDFFEAVTQVEKTDSRKFNVDEKMLKQSKNYIKLSDITLFLCENHPFNEQTLPPGIKIPTKSIPLPKIFDNSTTERVLRDIDLNAPIIYRDSNESLQRLNKDKIHIDSVHHNNNMITKSIYAQEINKLIVLDQYSDIFIVYDNDCNMVSKFRPTSQHLRGQVCIDFYWSEKQMRIGTVFRDNYLAFWDSSDNFQFEKSFNIAESKQNDETIFDEQIKIWYIKCIDSWITSDNHKAIHFWNIEKEEISSSIKSDLFLKGIINIIEVDYLKVVVIGSSDNYVSIWDFIGQKLLFQINVSHTHLNSLSYFQTYQVILTGGYDNQISIYQFHPTYNDANKLGELYGHMSIVTGVKGIEGTPMIVSTDDKYHVKIWDVRTTNCIQSIDIDLRNPIKQIHTTRDRVFFQSSRVTSVEFDIDMQQKIEIHKSMKTFSALQGFSDDYQPIGSLLNIKKKELIACTTKDVRFFDIQNGRIKKIIASLSENKEDSITSYQVIDQFQKIIIGTQKGMLRIHDLKTGELLSEINSHTNEITGLKLDHLNKLLLTTSSDSSILIQKINPKLQSQKYREVHNSHYGQEISFVEVSVYHNIYITASFDNVLLIWSYEFGRLMASFELEADQEPTAITIINGYSIIIVATTKGYIYFIRFTHIDDNLDLEIIANINIIKSLILRGEALKKLVASEVKRAFQLQEQQQRTLQNEKKKLKIQEDKLKGTIPNNDIKKQQINQNSTIFPDKSVKTGQQMNNNNKQNQQANKLNIQDNKSNIQDYKSSVQESKMNILENVKFTNSTNKPTNNPLDNKSITQDSRKAKQLLNINNQRKLSVNKDLEDIQNKKFDITQLYNENEVKIEGDDKDLFNLGFNKKNNNFAQINNKKESNIFANKLIFDLCLNQDNEIDFENINTSKNKLVLPETCTLIVGVNNGEIRKYDISSIFKRNNIKLIPHCRNKMNYNAFRQNYENYTNTMSNHKIQCFKQNKNNIMKDIIVLNNMSRSKVISKFQYSVMKLSQVRGLIISNDDAERPFDPYFNQSKNMVDLVQGHKSQLTSLEFMKVHNSQNEMIISCGQDNYIKIWNYFGKISLVAAVNISHPLPIKWEFKIDYDLIYQNKILIAIKSLEAVLQKYDTHMDFSKYQKFNLRNLLNYLDKKELEEQENLKEKALKNRILSPKKNRSLEKDDSPIKIKTEKENIKQKSSSQHISREDLNENDKQENKIRVMRDEYTPRDLLFNKVKHLYTKELIGPSLIQLQEIKRIQNSKNQTTTHKNIRKVDEYQHFLNQEEKNKETKFYSTFFHPDYRRKMLERFNEANYFDCPKEVLLLEKKLDNMLAKKVISDSYQPVIQIAHPPPSQRASNPSLTNQMHQNNQNNHEHDKQRIQLNQTASQQSKQGYHDLQGIFMTLQPTPQQQGNNMNNLSDQIFTDNKNYLNVGSNTERSKYNPSTILSGAQSARNSHRSSNFFQAAPIQISGDQIISSQTIEQNQKSHSKLDNQENSTGYGSIQNNFQQSKQGNQDQLSISQQLYFTSKDYHPHSSSTKPHYSNFDSMKQSNSQDRGLSAQPITIFNKSISQQAIDSESSKQRFSLPLNDNKKNKQPNNISLRDEFNLKKEAKEIFNFNKKIPQSTTDRFQTGGEYLIQINRLERNHGMKFKLFEKGNQKSRIYSQTTRNSQSPKSHNYLQLQNSNKKTNPTSSNIQNSINNVQNESLQNNLSKEFLEYAQEKYLMSQYLQDNYNKQCNQISTTQAKHYFLNQIENETDHKTFNDKFESTVIQHPISLTQSQPINIISSFNENKLQSSIIKNNNIIPPLNLTSNFNSMYANQHHSHSQLNSSNRQQTQQQQQQSQQQQQQNQQQQSKNEFDSTQDSSIIPINSKQQQFCKTSRKCFQNVVKNMNQKLNKCRINHNRGKEFRNNYHSNGTDDDFNHHEYNKNNNNNNNSEECSHPFLSQRAFRNSKDQLLKNSFLSQIQQDKQQLQLKHQSVNFK